MTGPSPDLWLIRHGETEWSRTGRHTGRTDVVLTPRGEQDAIGLRQRLAGQRFALVLSSPLRRAWETCRLAGLGDAARPDADLLEWDYGAYEGRRAEEIRAEVPGWLLWRDGVPAGETLEQVAARAGRVLGRVAGAAGPVALFAHGHLLRVLAACWIGLPPAAAQRLLLDTAAIGCLGQQGDVRVVRWWNRTPGPP